MDTYIVLLSLFAAANQGLMISQGESSHLIKCLTNCTCQIQRNGDIVGANCSGLQWMSIPAELPKTLRWLDLSRNKISGLRKSCFSHLEHLQDLDLSYNKITELSGEFDVMKSSDVDSGDNSVLYFQRKALYNVSTHDNSPLNSAQMKTHQGVHGTVRDQTLKTEVNKTSPFGAGSLKQLRTLNLRYNNLTSIENNTFMSLSALQSLDLSYNKITILRPLAFCGLHQLLSLNLKNNSIPMLRSSYPDKVFADLTSLVELNLQKNLYYPKHLEELQASSLEFLEAADYPDHALSYIETLQRLHLDGLPQEKIPGTGFRNLTALTLLDLGCPGLRCYVNGLVENFFSNITTTKPLEVLFTDCNIISIHPKTFAYIPTLHSLSLRGNDNLEFERFHNGSISLNQTQIKRLDISTIHRLDLIALKAEWLEHLRTTSLETLIIEKDQILDIEPKALVHLPRSIKNFFIGHNKLITSDYFVGLLWMENLEVFNISVQNKYRMNRADSHTSVLSNESAVQNSVQNSESTFQKELHKNGPTLQKGVQNNEASSNYRNYGANQDNEKTASLRQRFPKYSQSNSSWMSNLFHGVGRNRSNHLPRFRNHSLKITSKDTKYTHPKSHENNDLISIQDLFILQQQFCPSYQSRVPGKWNGSNNVTYKISRPNRLKLMYSLINSSHSKVSQKHVKTRPVMLPRKLKEAYGSELKLGYAIPEMPFLPNVVEVLDISKNFLWCFEGPVKGLRTLRELDLSNNYCIAISPYFFSDMPELRTLHLQYNTIGPSLEADESGETFSKLGNLEYIDLAHNDIRILSQYVFSNSRKLQTVLLSNNALRVFDSDIGHLQNLSLLDLSSNNLLRLSPKTMQEVDEILSINEDLKLTIDLHHNNLKCDCSSVDFLSWYRTTKAVFREKEMYTCEYINGSTVRLEDVDQFCTELWKFCHGPDFLMVALVILLLVVVFWASFGIFRYFRVRLLFYVYISKARYFQNFANPEQFEVKDVFLVYDEDEPKWRRFVSRVVKPTLEERGVTCYLSETDSQAGKPIRMVVEESVLAGKKTLVLLSEELFMFKERELEVNMAKLSEELRMTKVLLFVALEQIPLESVPLHIVRYLEENKPMIYRENDPTFWDKLIQTIKS